MFQTEYTCVAHLRPCFKNIMLSYHHNVVEWGLLDKSLVKWISPFFKSHKGKSQHYHTILAPHGITAFGS